MRQSIWAVMALPRRSIPGVYCWFRMIAARCRGIVVEGVATGGTFLVVLVWIPVD